jgi:hypothetical protein
MAWTTPKTDWVAGDAVTAALMNNIGNNLAALKAPPSSAYVVDESGSYTTTSASFVNVDATNLSLTITTTGGDVMVHFHGVTDHDSASGITYLDVDVDGARTAGDDGICGQFGTNESTVSFTRLISGLSAGSHTFKLQWKVSAGTGAIYTGSVAGRAWHPQFWVREVS